MACWVWQRPCLPFPSFFPWGWQGCMCFQGAGNIRELLSGGRKNFQKVGVTLWESQVHFPGGPGGRY